jgi:TrmH family RNA methyltransferase
MAERVGVHAQRLGSVRALLSVKGRRDARRFSFEGATLLAEAFRSGTQIEEVYATQAAYDRHAIVREVEARGTPTYLVDDRSAARISDLETPSGIVAVATSALAPLERLFAADGTVLVLADLNDPGNAGTLLRSADAFGAAGLVFGRLGVDPYHPKVVRAAMGAIFRVPLALADPAELADAAAAGAFQIAGLTASGAPLRSSPLPPRIAFIVGHERHGLGLWSQACRTSFGIPMRGAAESLNAAIAGSIALYEAAGGQRLAAGVPLPADHVK